MIHRREKVLEFFLEKPSNLASGGVCSWLPRFHKSPKRPKTDDDDVFSTLVQQCRLFRQKAEKIYFRSGPNWTADQKWSHFGRAPQIGSAKNFPFSKDCNDPLIENCRNSISPFLSDKPIAPKFYASIVDRPWVIFKGNFDLQLRH